MASRGLCMVMKSLMTQRVSPITEALNFIELKADKDGFKSRYINSVIGHGVFTTEHFSQGSFLLEYVGELKKGNTQSEKTDGTTSRKKYPRCYEYYFRHCEKLWMLDATKPDGRLCRLVNDSTERESNSRMKKIMVNNVPHLCLFATKDIPANTELRYDYGVDDTWWRKRAIQTSVAEKKGNAAGSTNETNEWMNWQKKSKPCFLDVLPLLRLPHLSTASVI